MQDDDAGFDLTGWSDDALAGLARALAFDLETSPDGKRTDDWDFGHSDSVAALLRELAARIEGRRA